MLSAVMREPAAGEHETRSGERADDARVLAGYLEGDGPSFRLVDRWIRVELQRRFPVLANEIDDTAQVVHQKLLTNLRGGRFQQRAALKTYVVRISRYTAVDLVRKRHRSRIVGSAEHEDGTPVEPPQDGPYRSLLDLEQGQLLRQLLLLAPEDCRTLWRLAYVDSLAYAEIADRLTLPMGTVKSRMWACRRKIVSLLAELRVGCTNLTDPEVSS
ncbi:MAG: RNA polymerase sigma factor [Acidobacteriota bacterium]